MPSQWINAVLALVRWRSKHSLQWHRARFGKPLEWLMNGRLTGYNWPLAILIRELYTKR
ncbi:hypothetical protein FD10_GL002380 [Lactiplantibacillus argentoratensis DSM 16365]|nr:hypothetical protein FD10_GL002380 [Lactiplantibacillus argentoratensis DSM 16365]